MEGSYEQDPKTDHDRDAHEAYQCHDEKRFPFHDTRRPFLHTQWLLSIPGVNVGAEHGFLSEAALTVPACELLIFFGRPFSRCPLHMLML
jgi:hypothetical protein